MIVLAAFTLARLSWRFQLCSADTLAKCFSEMLAYDIESVLSAPACKYLPSVLCLTSRQQPIGRLLRFEMVVQHGHQQQWQWKAWLLQLMETMMAQASQLCWQYFDSISGIDLLLPASVTGGAVSVCVCHLIWLWVIDLHQQETLSHNNIVSVPTLFFILLGILSNLVQTNQRTNKCTLW